MLKITANLLDTFLPKSIIVPCNFACPRRASNGITVAETRKPMATNHQSDPALKPKSGGRIKFPAPKNEAKMAKPNTKICLVLFIDSECYKYSKLARQIILYAKSTL